MDLLDPKLDVVFKMLFAAEENRDILRAFLEAVLKPEAPIREIEVLNPELPKDGADEKGLILDLRLRLASGEIVNVELQRVNRSTIFPRVLAYWSKCYVGQLGRGDDYHALLPVISILVADFVSFPWSSGYHHVFDLRERREQFPLLDHLRMHVLSLPRLPSLEDAAPGDDVVNWGRFFKSGSDPAVLERLAMRSPELEKARQALLALSGDPEARERAERRFMDRYFYELDLQEDREKARAEGLAEGRAEGRAEGEAKGRAEAILRICEARGIALTHAQQGRILACSEPGQLDRWLAVAVTATDADQLFDRQP
jgi:predicted transposase/invertase (TIGR01784 family)